MVGNTIGVALRNNQGSCQGQGIYVYDLPSKFNKDLLQECSDMVLWVNFCSYFETMGLVNRLRIRISILLNRSFILVF